MQDIKIVWDNDLLAGDFSTIVNSGDVETEDGLTTAVLISLFTDRRARDDDELPDFNSTDKRGWWGDQLNPEPADDEIGSRLWLVIERAKTIESVQSEVRMMIEEALQWLIDDGVVSSINVETERVEVVDGDNRLYVLIEIKKNDSEDTNYSLKFDSLWEAQFSVV